MRAGMGDCPESGVYPTKCFWKSGSNLSLRGNLPRVVLCLELYIDSFFGHVGCAHQNQEIVSGILSLKEYQAGKPNISVMLQIGSFMSRWTPRQSKDHQSLNHSNTNKLITPDQRIVSRSTLAAASLPDRAQFSSEIPSRYPPANSSPGRRELSYRRAFTLRP